VYVSYDISVRITQKHLVSSSNSTVTCRRDVFTKPLLRNVVCLQSHPIATALHATISYRVRRENLNPSSVNRRKKNTKLFIGPWIKILIISHKSMKCVLLVVNIFSRNERFFLRTSFLSLPQGRHIFYRRISTFEFRSACRCAPGPSGTRTGCKKAVHL
jgi:hypothetical protein